MKIFSFDAEVNGLYGPSFAIAATVREEGVEVARFEGRVPDTFVTHQRAVRRSLEAVQDMEITHEDSASLEEAFWHFWMEHKGGAIVIAHCGSPVESGLFRRCVERNVEEREYEGPFPAIHDAATFLLLAGENPASADDYAKRHSLVIPFEGSPHHPLYDSVVAAVVVEHIVQSLRFEVAISRAMGEFVYSDD